MQPHEKIAAVLTVRDWEEGKFVVMGTRRGVIKKTGAHRLQQSTGRRHHRHGDRGRRRGDRRRNQRRLGHVPIATRNGMAIRFEEADVRTTGRGAYGVRGMSSATRMSSSPWRCCARARRADADRERLRQAHGDRRVSGDRKGRTRYHQHPGDRAERPGRRRGVRAQRPTR